MSAAPSCEQETGKLANFDLKWLCGRRRCLGLFIWLENYLKYFFSQNILLKITKCSSERHLLHFGSSSDKSWQIADPSIGFLSRPSPSLPHCLSNSLGLRNTRLAMALAMTDAEAGKFPPEKQRRLKDDKSSLREVRSCPKVISSNSSSSPLSPLVSCSCLMPSISS